MHKDVRLRCSDNGKISQSDEIVGGMDVSCSCILPFMSTRTVRWQAASRFVKLQKIINPPNKYVSSHQISKSCIIKHTLSCVCIVNVYYRLVLRPFIFYFHGILRRKRFNFSKNENPKGNMVKTNTSLGSFFFTMQFIFQRYLDRPTFLSPRAIIIQGAIKKYMFFLIF